MTILAVAKLQAEQTLLLDSKKQLAESETRYRILAENASDMMVVLDLQFVRRYVSPGSLDLTGYTPEELMAQAPQSMFHPDDAALIQATFRNLVASPGSAKQRATYRLRHRDGHWIWVEARVQYRADWRRAIGDLCHVARRYSACDLGDRPARERGTLSPATAKRWRYRSNLHA